MTMVRSRRATPALAATAFGGNTPVFNNQLELNATSNADAIKVLANLFEGVRTGRVTFDQKENAPLAELSSIEERRAHVIEAYNDRSTSRWAEMGSDISATIQDTVIRQGFMRNYLLRAELAQGSIPRLETRQNKVTAVLATGPGEVTPEWVRGRYVYPAEFYISANVRVEQREIDQGSSDLLEDVYLRAQESIMVQEDRTYLNLLNRTVGISNDLSVLAGGITPANLVALRHVITRWGLPAYSLLMADAGWNDIVGNALEWGRLFEPLSQYTIIQTGRLGTLMGMSILTDGFRDPQQRVLGPNELFVIANPEYHGAYTDRGPVQATPVDSYPEGSPSRGWFMFESLSMGVTNPRSVARAVRA